jgi:hypothetical protein
MLDLGSYQAAWLMMRRIRYAVRRARIVTLDIEIGAPTGSRSTTAKPRREGPLRIPIRFDDAMTLAVQVKPPAEGWTIYGQRLKSREGQALARAQAARTPAA